MGTPPKFPFDVRFHFVTGDRNYSKSLLNLTENIDEADVDATAITEYRSCSLDFTPLVADVPGDARLYLDGLDALSDPNLMMDGDRTYIPCGTTVQIQSYDDTAFPWIPGNYWVQVRWDGRSYYTVLRVRPVHLKEDQLRRMREELEAYVVGLTIDLVRRNQGLGRSELARQLPIRFYQYQLLEKNFAKVVQMVSDILRAPKHEVQRVHTVLPFGEAPLRDQASYRWMHSASGYAKNGGAVHASQARFAFVPTSQVYYDLPENRWVKRILKRLIKMMDEIVDSMDHHTALDQKVAERLKKEKDRQSKTIRRLQSTLRMFLAHPLFREVQDSSGPLPYTPAMQRDGRYRSLFRFWQDLMDHSDVRVDASFEFQWKKTDLLWEYWSFVRTIQALQALGFEPVSGWIYDETWRFPQRIFIPTIPDGTELVMTRGDERILVYYSDKLPTSREEAHRAGKLLYVGLGHNWPDIRLDYLKGGEYKYSVIVEAKYRKSRNIWPKDDFSQRKTQVMNQLEYYRNAGSRVDDPDGMRRAVREVVVLYPRDPDRDPISAGGDWIYLVQMEPGASNRHYVDHLAKFWGRST